MVDLTGKNLIVVDMQPGYRRSMTSGVLDTVEALVSRAVQADSLVCFLEFCDAPTYKRLTDRVRRYDQFVIEQKQQCDGSDNVLAACRRGQYEQDAFVVCGVDTFECVQETVLALARQLPEATFEVVMEGCGTRKVLGWEQFELLPNIKLVHLN